jgi:hypothetical protein
MPIILHRHDLAVTALSAGHFESSCQFEVLPVSSPSAGLAQLSIPVPPHPHIAIRCSKRRKRFWFHRTLALQVPPQCRRGQRMNKILVTDDCADMRVVVPSVMPVQAEILSSIDSCLMKVSAYSSNTNPAAACASPLDFALRAESSINSRFASFSDTSRNCIKYSPAAEIRRSLSF